MLELRARGELARWVERLHGLLVGHLPGRNGELELPELLSGLVLGVGRERLLELFGRHLSTILGCFQLHFMRCGDIVELDRCVCVEHLCALFGGLLHFNCGDLSLRCLRGG